MLILWAAGTREMEAVGGCSDNVSLIPPAKYYKEALHCFTTLLFW